MAFTASQLEEISAWCADNRDLAADRGLARKQFFGEQDDRTVSYWEGAGDPTSRQRRFLGWFMFDFRLSDDRQPAQVAVEALYGGADLVEARDAVRRTRFVMAIVRSSDGKRSNFLELEDERFEVHNAQWAQMLSRGSTVVAHLVPVRNRYWLAGPGWLEWPIGIGPNMRHQLKKFQPDPVQIERLMQGRVSDGAREQRSEVPPQDATLEAAVARLTTAATEAGRPELVLSVEEWRALVLRHMGDTDPNAYFSEIIGRMGSAASIEDLNLWLGLVNNIWNATPQPDRGGKTAAELSAPWRSPRQSR
jgi:hypothetical protein